MFGVFADFFPGHFLIFYEESLLSHLLCVAPNLMQMNSERRRYKRCLIPKSCTNENAATTKNSGKLTRQMEKFLLLSGKILNTIKC